MSLQDCNRKLVTSNAKTINETQLAQSQCKSFFFCEKITLHFFVHNRSNEYKVTQKYFLKKFSSIIDQTPLLLWNSFDSCFNNNELGKLVLVIIYLRHNYLTIHFPPTTVKTNTQLIIIVFIYKCISIYFNHLYIDGFNLCFKVSSLF